MTSPPSDHEPLPQLTAKQREVIALVADNRTSKEIAALLGISVSAVNQRIEMIRARLGGIPRGELARLYRQEFTRNGVKSVSFAPNWQKIQVSSDEPDDQEAMVESISAQVLTGPRSGPDRVGDGSQLSAPSSIPGGPRWLARDHRLLAVLRAFAIAVIVLAGMAIAAEVTHLVS